MTLASPARAPSAHVGHAMTLPVPAGALPPFVDSLGRRASPAPDAAGVIVQPAPAPGAITVFDASGRAVAMVAVNAAPEESDITHASPADVQPDPAGASMQRETASIPLTPALLTLALACALVEAALILLPRRRAPAPREATA